MDYATGTKKKDKNKEKKRNSGKMKTLSNIVVKNGTKTPCEEGGEELANNIIWSSQVSHTKAFGITVASRLKYVFSGVDTIQYNEYQPQQLETIPK